MKITPFTMDHIEKAIQLIKRNYEEERKFVPELPKTVFYPDLALFAQNELGVAAFENNNMLGFLSCFSPFQNAFGSTNVTGIFSPLHGNGTIPEGRAKIYAYMYQAAAKKWVDIGATSHAICLYAHSKNAHEMFFQYGFGLRCIDALRTMETIETPIPDNIHFIELSKENICLILPLHKLEIHHYKQSPTFFHYPIKDDELLNRILINNQRCFVAKKNDKIIAYLKVSSEGETFITNDKQMMNICGSFCLPEYRGNGLFLNLLNFTITALKNEGYTLLGVDFESFNPTAYGFWLKHFTAYTYGVVRRVDENALG